MATGLRNSTKGPAEAVHRLHNDDFHAFVDRSEAPITRARISRWRDPMWRRTEEASGMTPIMPRYYVSRATVAATSSIEFRHAPRDWVFS